MSKEFRDTFAIKDIKQYNNSSSGQIEIYKDENYDPNLCSEGNHQQLTAEKDNDLRYSSNSRHTKYGNGSTVVIQNEESKYFPTITNNNNNSYLNYCGENSEII